MAKGITVPVTQTGLDKSIQNAVKQVGGITVPVDIDSRSFKNLSQPLGRITGLATEFEKSIAASNARVIAFGASVGIINGIQGAFAELLRTGIEVQKILADIAAISGQSGAELSKFGDSIFDVAKNTSQSFKVAAQAALEFSRQGLSTDETIKRTNDALTLVRFTTLNAAEAVDVLTAATNSFSDSGITTSEILNKLVAVDTKFAVSAEDLANGLARAGSIAQEVGVSFDELNAAITITQERTARGGAVIGNALKTIFTRLRSDETVNALRSIGVESLNAQGGLKGAIPLLQEVATKIESLSGGERVQILEAIASKYNINILSALLNDLNAANGKFAEVVQISGAAQNQAYERQIELNKTLAAQINLTTVSVTQLFNKLSEIGVTESLTSILKFVNDLLDGFNKLLDSETTGGNIAKGLIKGISDVFFTVGLPIIGAIFIKLTKDIAQFGVESLKTILGINQQVRERQALEQAVVNTLIKDRDVMASILALSGNRAKQEEYLLNVYNRQISALERVQSIATSVAPALMQGGLSATSGTVQRRAAEGYLPAQEAADVKRGVGGADKNAKVVKIPNFSFGGGKKGTMYANTSEYIVPNYNGGDGTAIFNKDMVRKYGKPENAKKINAATGYIPNFADGKYIYDSDRLPADKNALLKKILASNVKKNLILGPAGTGKTTFAAAGGTFIAKPEDADKATEIDILSGAARTKDGGISANLESIISAVNVSGGKVSYLYAGNMEIIARRSGREEKGAGEGDLRSEKQIAGTKYAPLNQFDFIDKVKSKAKNFGIVKNAANGYIPNFAQKAQVQASEPQTEQSDSITIADARGRSAMLVPDKKNEQVMEAYLNEPLSFGFQTKDKGKKFGIDYVKYHTYGLNQEAFQSEGLKKSGDLTNIEADVQAFGLDIAKKYSYEYAAEYSKSLGGPATGIQISDTDVRKAFLASKGAVSGFSSLGGGIFETAIRTGVQGEINKDLLKAQQAELGSGKLDFKVTDIIKRLFGVNRGETDADSKIEGNPKSTGRAFADQIAANKLYSSTSKVNVKNAAAGYIPSFAKKEKTISALDTAAMLLPSEEEAKIVNKQSLRLGVIPSDEKSRETADRVKFQAYGLSEEGLKTRGIENKNVPDILSNVKSAVSTVGARIVNKFNPLSERINKDSFMPLFDDTEGAKGALSAVAGSVFEVAIQKVANPAQNKKASNDENVTFDVTSLTPDLKDLFGIKTPEKFADYKISAATKGKFADQVIKNTAYKKIAAMGYIPNYAEKLSEMYDWDGTIIPRMSGKPEEYIQSLQKLEKKDLLPIGKDLASSREKFDIATARPIAFREPIKQTAQRLGLNVEKIFPLGSMFENRRTMGVKGKPRKLYGPERKALFAEKTGRSIVDNQEDVLVALGSHGIDANLKNRGAFGFIPNFAEGLKQQDVLAPSGQFYDLDTADAFLAGSSVSLDPASTASKGLGKELKKRILDSARRVYGPKAQIGISRLPGQREAFTSAVLANPALADDFIALQKATTGGVGPTTNTPEALAKFNNPTPFDPTPWPAIRATGGKARTVKKTGPMSLSAAFGFVPNFADPLKEAVDREISAGVSPSQVRVTRDDRLTTTRNPEGLAVINTRDEPNGKVPSNRINEKNGKMAARGFVPNFAKGDITKKRQGKSWQYFIEEDNGRLKSISIEEGQRLEGESLTGAASKPVSGGSSSSTANPPVDNKALESFNLGILKTSALFGALQTATYVLEGTIKNSDSAILKFSKSITEIGSKATLGLTLGEGLKPVLSGIGENLSNSQTKWIKSLGGFTNSLSSAVPIVGAVVGGLTGLVSILDEFTSRDKKKGEGQAAEFLKTTQGLNPEDQRREIEKKLVELNKKETEKTTALSGYEERRRSLNLALSAGNMGGMGRGVGFTSAVSAQTEVESAASADLQNIQGQREALQKALVDLAEQETQERRRQEGIERKAQDELVKRIALTTQISALNEANAKGENAALELRAKRQADFIKNSIFLTETAKQNLQDAEALTQLDEKRDDLRKSILLNTVKEISQGKLTDVDKQKLDSLRKRLEAGENIIDIQAELNALDIKGNSEATVKIKNALSEFRIKDGQLVTEKAITAEKQAANKQAKIALDIEKLRLNYLEQSFKNQKELEDITITGRRTIEEATARTPIAQLENQIATQPYATREQEAQLIKLRAEFAKLSAQRKIDNDFADTQRKGFEELRASIISNVKAASELGKEFIDEREESLRSAKNTSDLIATLEELRKVRSNLLLEKEANLGFTTEEDNKKLKETESAINLSEGALKKYNSTVDQAKVLLAEYNKQQQRQIEFQTKLAQLKAESPAKAGIFAAFNEIEQQAYNFQETFAKNTTLAFRDGLTDALDAAISKSDDLNAALQNVAIGFLKTMQQQFLKNAADNAMLALKQAFPKLNVKLPTGLALPESKPATPVVSGATQTYTAPVLKNSSIVGSTSSLPEFNYSLKDKTYLSQDNIAPADYPFNKKPFELSKEIKAVAVNAATFDAKLFQASTFNTSGAITASGLTSGQITASGLNSGPIVGSTLSLGGAITGTALALSTITASALIVNGPITGAGGVTGTGIGGGAATGGTTGNVVNSAVKNYFESSDFGEASVSPQEIGKALTEQQRLDKSLREFFGEMDSQQAQVRKAEQALALNVARSPSAESFNIAPEVRARIADQNIQLREALRPDAISQMSQAGAPAQLATRSAVPASVIIQAPPMQDRIGAQEIQPDRSGSKVRLGEQGPVSSFFAAFKRMFGFNTGGFVKGYAGGGLVTGGSGYKDDVPAMLSNGEYVIRKSSVEKYGAKNLAKLNSGQEPPKFAMGGYVPRFAAGGDIFLPGVRGGTAISGYKDLTRFANQVTTSGSTDVMKGSGSSAFINLEDQSMRLSRFALLNEDDIANQEIRSAQQQGLDLITQREKYRTEQRKAFQRQLKQTVISAALNAGLGALRTPSPTSFSGQGIGSQLYSQSIMAPGTSPLSAGPSFSSSSGPASFGSYTALMPRAPFKAYGGSISKYADGGPVDKIPALLMDGEYVMSNKAVKKHGKQFFDSLNQGRAPRFANGGEVGTGSEMLGEKFDNLSNKLETKGSSEVNITVNVTNSGSSETKTQGESNQGGIDYKKMSEKIKAVVLETINEEKRLGGSLRPRN